MKKVYIKCDTNDADYIGAIVEVSEKDIEYFKPLIEKIKANKDHVWGYGELAEEDWCDPCIHYNITREEADEFEEAFHLGCCSNEFGFHTIEEITIIEVVESLL